MVFSVSLQAFRPSTLTHKYTQYFLVRQVKLVKKPVILGTIGDNCGKHTKNAEQAAVFTPMPKSKEKSSVGAKTGRDNKVMKIIKVFIQHTPICKNRR
jgi:hypothetical protein